MYSSKFRRRKVVGLACMLVLVWMLMITSTAFADSEVPADAPESGAAPVQTGETGESDQPDEVEETEPAAETSSTDESEEPAADEQTDSTETSGEEQDQSSSDEQTGEDGLEYPPLDEGSPGEDDAEEEPVENTSEQEDDQSGEEGSVGDDAEDSEDDGVPSEEEDAETSEMEETQDEVAVEIVDEDGEALDMASKEDAELASSGDPYWLVGKQYYSVAETEGGCYEGTSVGAGTCWVSSTPIATALDMIEEGLLPNDRKLYVMSGEYEGDLDFNGFFLSQMNGLIGVEGSGTTVINGNVTIAYNTGGFTLSGFTINGGVEITDTTGNVVLEDLNVSNPAGDGIKVYNKEWYAYNEATGQYDIQIDGPKFSGKVSVENVNSSNNLGMGAHIWTMSNITVNNSSFNNNGGTDGVDDPVDSLYLDNSWGTGSVYVSGVSASNNNGTGVRIDSGRNATLEGVVANMNTAPSYDADPGDYDYGFGLYLNSSTGKIDLDYIFTNSNEMDGMYVDGYKATILMGNMNASDNGICGIEVYTQGALTIDIAATNNNGDEGIFAMIGKTVKLSSLISNGNNSEGLRIAPYPIYEYDEVEEEYVLTGYMGPTSVILTSPKNGGANMANTFSGNGEDGVYIKAKGTVTLSNLDVIDNGGTGIYVENMLYDEDSDRYFGKGNVTINVTIKGWYNGVSENGAGIEIHSLGVVKIYDTSAIENDSDGVYVDAQNTIMLTDVIAESNDGYGAYLTTLSSPKGRTVTITDCQFNGNNNAGIMVLTAGVINFKGSSASGNTSPNLGGPLNFPISIHDIVYSTDATESWGFYGYEGDAINILLESGDFDFTVTLYDSLNNVIADNSGSAGSSADINVVLNGDDWYRIEIGQSGMTGSYGQYTLSVNDADQEHNIYPGSGAILDNSAGKAKVVISTTRDNPQNVFNNNQNFGLLIDSNSSVVITGATASHNYTGGLRVVNPDSTGSVVLQDKSSEPFSNFDGNGGEGVNIQTQGTINLYGVSASFNNGAGILLVNSFYDSETETYIGRGSVTFNMRKNTMSMIEGNEVHGLAILSNGTINVTNLIAKNNGANGAILDNYSGTGSVNVRTSGTNVVNEFSENGWNTQFSNNLNGLKVISRGNISVKNSLANENNNGIGMALYNEDAISPRKVQVTDGEACSNNGYGLQIESKGAVLIMKFQANQNGWNGIDVDACQEDGGICQGNGYLKLSEVNARENGGVGIQAHAMSTINLSKVYADNNGDKGIRLNNQFDGSKASVTLINVGANENNNTGILVTTNGAVTMREIQADNNLMTSGYLNVGDAAHEYYNDGAGADRWNFDAESGVELFIRLAPSLILSLDNGFAGSLELYDDGNNLISGYTVIGDGTWTGIQWTPSETGSYYVLVTENNQEDDFYQISINNETYDDMAFYFVDGAAITAGTNVTMTGSSTNNSFRNNSVAGLYIEAPGNINLRNISADDNGTQGAVVNNFLDDGAGNPTGYGKVNVSGRNDSLHSTFHGNGWQGLDIKSNSVVSLLYLDTFSNGMEGIRLGNVDDEPEEELVAEDYIGGKVSAKYIRLSGNGKDGLQINSLQNVTLTGISANQNGSNGVFVTTEYGSGGITVSGYNYFWGNNSYGIGARSNEGDVKLYGIDARGNGNAGIMGLSFLGQAFLDKSHVQESGTTGILLASGVNIRVTKVTSMANGPESDGDGIFLYADSDTAINIKLSTFVGNGGNGIEVSYIDSIGPVPVITSTLYFGNDVDYDGTIEEANIYLHS